MGVSNFSDIHSSRRSSKEKKRLYWQLLNFCRLTLRWGLMYLTKIENQAWCVTWTVTSHAEPHILCTNIPFFFFAAIVLTIYSLFSLSLSCVVSQCRVLLSFPILPSWHCLSLSPTPPFLLLHARLFRSSVSPRFAVPLWLHSTLLLDCYQPFCCCCCLFVCLFLLVPSRTFSPSLVSPLLQQVHPSLYYFSYFVTFFFFSFSYW